MLPGYRIVERLSVTASVGQPMPSMCPLSDELPNINGCRDGPSLEGSMERFDVRRQHRYPRRQDHVNNAWTTAIMKLFDSVDEQVIPCWNKSCSPSLSNCARLTVDCVQTVFKSIEDVLGPAVEDYGGPNQQSVPTTNVAPLTDVQWADSYVLQQGLLTRLWVACVTHDALAENSNLIFMRPSYVTVIASRVLDERHRLSDTVLEVHGDGMVGHKQVLGAQYH